MQVSHARPAQDAPVRRFRSSARHAVPAVVVTAAAMLTASCSLVELFAPPELEDLAVKPESHESSYERDAFGQRWKDVDGNGCGQRDDVLARDLTRVKFKDRCVVIGGVLTDPYSGERVTFSKDRAESVQIDHRVALAEAWRSGAWAWRTSDRERFANDLANLVALSGRTNNAKSDRDAAEWLPARPEAVCGFARDVVKIKGKYGLSVDAAEAHALRRALDRCPDATPSG